MQLLAKDCLSVSVCSACLRALHIGAFRDFSFQRWKEYQCSSVKETQMYIYAQIRHEYATQPVAPTHMLPECIPHFILLCALRYRAIEISIPFNVRPSRSICVCIEITHWCQLNSPNPVDLMPNQIRILTSFQSIQTLDPGWVAEMRFRRDAQVFVCC